MATPAYMTITDIHQTLLTEDAFTENSVGNSYQNDHKNEILVQSFQHRVTLPRDPQSGQPTGQRIHQPLIISKVFDRTSPLLMEVLCSGEVLPKVEIKWYRTSKLGIQEHYYTTTLEDAIIVEIKDYMLNCQDPANAHSTHLQEVHFTYRKITWLHDISTTTGSDDWRSPAVR